jgi:hypothetical protein
MGVRVVVGDPVAALVGAVVSAGVAMGTEAVCAGSGSLRWGAEGPWLSSWVPAVRSGGRGERSCLGKGVGERFGPGPLGMQAQRRGAGVKGQAIGDVQQPVAQALGLAARQIAGQQQALGPDEQVVRDADEHQPDAVVLEVPERHVAQAGVLVVADLRLGVRVLAPAMLEHLDIRVGLVGQDGLEAMAVMVGKRQLRAGMRALAPDDHPRARRPAVRSRSLVISAICPFCRGVPSLANAAIHASSEILRIAARTCSVSSKATE